MTKSTRNSVESIFFINQLPETYASQIASLKGGRSPEEQKMIDQAADCYTDKDTSGNPKECLDDLEKEKGYSSMALRLNYSRFSQGTTRNLDAKDGYVWDLNFLDLAKAEFRPNRIFMAGIEGGGGFLFGRIHADRVAYPENSEAYAIDRDMWQLGAQGNVNPYIGLAPTSAIPLFVTAEANGRAGVGAILSDTLNIQNQNESGVNFFVRGGIGLGLRLPIPLTNSSDLNFSAKIYLLQAMLSTTLTSTDFKPGPEFFIQYEF